MGFYIGQKRNSAVKGGKQGASLGIRTYYVMCRCVEYVRRLRNFVQIVRTRLPSQAIDLAGCVSGEKRVTYK